MKSKGKTININRQAVKEEDGIKIKEIYRQRARQLARRRTQVFGQVKDIPILVFLLEKERYGIELEMLMEIVPFQNCTPVPGAHHAVEGVINIRGEIRCVMDLARLIDLERPGNHEPDTGGYVLILKKNKVGLKIDTIERIVLIREDRCREITGVKADAAVSMGTGYTKGIIPGKILLLDVEQVLSHPVFASVSVSPDQIDKTKRRKHT